MSAVTPERVVIQPLPVILRDAHAQTSAGPDKLSVWQSVKADQGCSSKTRVALSAPNFALRKACYLLHFEVMKHEFI